MIDLPNHIPSLLEIRNKRTNYYPKLRNCVLEFAGVRIYYPLKYHRKLVNGGCDGMISRIIIFDETINYDWIEYVLHALNLKSIQTVGFYGKGGGDMRIIQRVDGLRMFEAIFPDYKDYYQIRSFTFRSIRKFFDNYAYVESLHNITPQFRISSYPSLPERSKNTLTNKRYYGCWFADEKLPPPPPHYLENPAREEDSYFYFSEWEYALFNVSFFNLSPD